jgi:hypothetical protein
MKILETLNLTIIEILAIVENAEIKLNKVWGEFGVIVKNKLNYVLGKNVDLLLEIFLWIKMKIRQMILKLHHPPHVVWNTLHLTWWTLNPPSAAKNWFWNLTTVH